MNLYLAVLIFNSINFNLTFTATNPLLGATIGRHGRWLICHCGRTLGLRTGGKVRQSGYRMMNSTDLGLGQRHRRHRYTLGSSLQ